eukprot:CAMPEP_0183553594 /NCGR_PEP_ID=MMETSP0371-20130417/75032_1 /TAXON_ID=268820 /ORGANISM="Peridinium aciculiferum, Strain PAER-2" /LENGTH=109 /DNA_ID=CAMNT_0025759113 /DNA_START=74 /DNA_END=399 /DNA_ORIENTATION=+
MPQCPSSTSTSKDEKPKSASSVAVTLSSQRCERLFRMSHDFSVRPTSMGRAHTLSFLGAPNLCTERRGLDIVVLSLSCMSRPRDASRRVCVGHVYRLPALSESVAMEWA